MSDLANQFSNTPSDLAGFHQFIGQQLNQGDVGLSPEEALDLWRSEHPLPEDFEETVAALREAFEEIDAGVEGIPAQQFFQEFRERHGLPPSP